MKKNVLASLNLALIMIASSLISCKKDPVTPTSTLQPTTNGNNNSGTQTTIAKSGLGLVDIDGNKYKSVIIGKQEWMAENLRVSKYNDGSIIPKVTSYDEWPILVTGAYVNYLDEITYDEDYGKLYNGYAVTTNKVCPTGWHVPTVADWKLLEDKVGGTDIAANKLKESGLKHWNGTTASVTNEALFNVLPGGGRYEFSYAYFGDEAKFWTSSVDSQSINNLYYKTFSKTSSYVGTNDYNKLAGYSIRCVKND